MNFELESSAIEYIKYSHDKWGNPPTFKSLKNKMAEREAEHYSPKCDPQLRECHKKWIGYYKMLEQYRYGKLSFEPKQPKFTIEYPPMEEENEVEDGDEMEVDLERLEKIRAAKINDVIQCINCGSDTVKTNNSKRYCEKCTAPETRKAGIKVGEKFPCVDCGTKIIKTSPSHKYCQSCAHERNLEAVRKVRSEGPRKPGDVECQICGKTFWDDAKRSDRKYCSKECYEKSKLKHKSERVEKNREEVRSGKGEESKQDPKPTKINRNKQFVDDYFNLDVKNKRIVDKITEYLIESINHPKLRIEFLDDNDLNLGVVIRPNTNSINISVVLTCEGAKEYTLISIIDSGDYDDEE